MIFIYSLLKACIFSEFNNNCVKVLQFLDGKCILKGDNYICLLCSYKIIYFSDHHEHWKNQYTQI